MVVMVRLDNHPESTTCHGLTSNKAKVAGRVHCTLQQQQKPFLASKVFLFFVYTFKGL
jgi:hypothetical protein